MKVLLTGSTGFLGRHVLARLLQESRVREVVGVTRQRAGQVYTDGVFRGHVSCELTDEVQVRRLLGAVNPDVIFHLAANPLIRPDSKDPVAISRSNILATHHLLAHCHPGARFVLASSAAVYGDTAQFGADEWSKPQPTSVYGATKVAAEALLATHPVSGLALRYVANVGAGATHGLLFDVIRKLRSTSETLDLLGDEPGSRKPFVHAADTAEATVRLGLDSALQGVLNIANDDSLAVLEVAQIVMDTLGLHKPVRWLGASANWRGDNPVVRINSRCARALGWQPRYARSVDAIRQAVLESQ